MERRMGQRNGLHTDPFRKGYLAMFGNRSLSLLFVVCVTGLGFGHASAPARAADILLTVTATLEWDDGYQYAFDQFGLDGASLTFTATFDSTSIYESHPFYSPNPYYPPIPSVPIISNSLTISGAVAPGVDGTYTDDERGLTFLPLEHGQIWGNAASGFSSGRYTYPSYFTADGYRLQLSNFLSPVTGPANGMAFSPSHISTTQNETGSYSFLGVFDIGEGGGLLDAYRFVNFQANVTVVPEPSSLALVGLAAGCLLLRARMRKPAY
jgi:hypothetical protein